MTRLHLLPKRETPPDKFRWVCPQDGYKVEAFNKGEWLGLIKRHHEINDYPLAADWVEEAEDQLCRLLPPGWCSYPDGSPQDHFVNPRIGLDAVIRGTKVFAIWLAGGAPVVSQQEAERRAKICAACYMCAPVEGCSSCVGLANHVADAIGNRTTKADAILGSRSCLACGCAARANIWFPVEISRHGVGQEQAEILMSVSHCWKGQALKELTANELQVGK